VLTNNPNNKILFVCINQPTSKQSDLIFLSIIHHGQFLWKPQIEKLPTPVSKSCESLFKLNHYSKISVLRSLYFAIFDSYLTCAYFIGEEPMTTFYFF